MPLELEVSFTPEEEKEIERKLQMQKRYSNCFEPPDKQGAFSLPLVAGRWSDGDFQTVGRDRGQPPESGG